MSEQYDTSGADINGFNDMQAPDIDDCCVKCADIYEFYLLTDAMVGEINHLREEVVRWRQVLLKYLPREWSEGLEQDIFDNVFRNFEDYSAYQRYMNHCYGGKDPFEDDEHIALMYRLKNGTDETSITYI